jgi:glycosyltransferase involved in cell wall biosynthesis
VLSPFITDVAVERKALDVAQAQRSPKVLVVAPQPFFQDRGTPIALRHVLESLSGLGFRVDVLTFPLGGSPAIADVRYLRVPNYLRFRYIPIGFSLRKVWLDLFLWWELRRLLRSGEYVCVHAVEEAAFLAVRAARARGIPLVYDMQSSIAEQLAQHWLLRWAPARWLVQRCETWALRCSDRVVCSAGLEERVRRLAPNTRVLRWVFPGSYEAGAASFRADVRAELGIDQGQPVVVYTGNFAEYQGISELLSAMQAVRKRHPDVVFLLVGAGLHEAGELRGPLEWIPAPLYRLVPRQPAERVALYLAASDVALSPRQYGSNLPLKVIEYLAAGLPVVATDIPAHTTLLSHETALLVEPSAEGLAAGVIRLLDDPELRRRYAAAAATYASEHLGPAAFVLLVAQLYGELEGVGLPR